MPEAAAIRPSPVKAHEIGERDRPGLAGERSQAGNGIEDPDLRGVGSRERLGERQRLRRSRSGEEHGSQNDDGDACEQRSMHHGFLQYFRTRAMWTAGSRGCLRG